MLKNWRLFLIPLIVYPHLISTGFVISAVLLFFLITDFFWMPLAEGPYSVVLFVCFFITVISTIIGLIKMNRSEDDYRKILFMNMLIKLLHMPAYTVIFLIGLLYASTVIGLIVTVSLLIIDCIVIFFSGMVGVIGILKMKREGKISSGQAVKYGICQFIFCIDVINAVVLYIKNVRSA